MMNSLAMVNKLYSDYKTRNTFMEEYYSSLFGRDVKIVLHPSAMTSSYNHQSGILSISQTNLSDFCKENPNIFATLFYSLIEHEIGHAMYTRHLPYSESSNILEDNRIEYHISKENHRVNFNAVNYIYQDMRLMNRFHDVLDNGLTYIVDARKTILKLMTLRSVDRKMFLDKLCTNQARTDIINDILLLNKRYRAKKYVIDNPLSEESVELKAMAEQFDNLIDLWFIESKDDDTQQDNTQKKDNDTQDEKQDDTKKKDDDTQDEQQDDNTQDEQQDEQQNKSYDDNNIDDVNMEEVVNEVMDMQEMSHTVNNAIRAVLPELIPEFIDVADYTKHNISIYDTKRHSGIKGSGNEHKSMGNAKQLDMKRYARQGFFKDEKLFKKTSEDTKGGKTAKVIFYLDISTSMRKLSSVNNGSDYISRISVVSDYLKSFYDRMHKYIDISIYGFGENTYKLNRNSLNNNYLAGVLEPDTRIDIVDENADLIIVLTDGAIQNIDNETQRSEGNYHKKFSKNFLSKSQFIILNDDKHRIDFYERYYAEIPNTMFVNSSNIVDGFEKATQKIKGKLR